MQTQDDLQLKFDGDLVRLVLAGGPRRAPAEYLGLAAAALRVGDLVLAVRLLRTARGLYPQGPVVAAAAQCVQRLFPEEFRPLGEVASVKVFGIGLSRTGTRSLNDAMALLGLRSAHWADAHGGILGWDEILSHDALSDTPIAFQFETLYHAFPQARFVFTVRDKAAWATSMQRHFHWIRSHQHLQDLCAQGTGKGVVGLPAWRVIHLALYANHASWADAFDAHEARVKRFFGAQVEPNLLRIDLTDPSTTDVQKWTALAQFVGAREVDIPLMPFPKRNVKTPEGAAATAAPSLPPAWTRPCGVAQLERLATRLAVQRGMQPKGVAKAPAVGRGRASELVAPSGAN
ncbi:MAG TPA: sulfotransferase [Ideonella sp.]|uniref:sulfotransferase n=1 Tax=Ideonella sp. TaxID=1929293 RepID=UPI002BF15003|nr:sulfotransferase [Ideonella sp.]HSI50744.1 sulfotransferase [Ideonella sp.]